MDANQVLVKSMKPVVTIPAGKKRELQRSINYLLQPYAGTIYFANIPLTELLDICRNYEVYPIQEDGTLWEGFLAGRKGAANISLAIQHGTEMVVAKNVLAINYYKMESGNWEVIAYIS
jgi:hypothetical protein